MKYGRSDSHPPRRPRPSATAGDPAPADAAVPDRLPAGDIAQALDLKPSTLSNYLSHLMQVGLVTQERIGTSLRYCPDMETLRGTFGFLWRDCCRGRPDLCPPFAPFPDSGAETMTHVPFKRPLHLHRQLRPVDLRRDAPARRSAAGGSTCIRPERGRNRS
jgi:DNA-binding transcriptional ArsR family regulator